MVMDLETVPDVANPYEAKPDDKGIPAAPHHEIVSGAVLTLGLSEGSVSMHGPRLLGPLGLDVADEHEIVTDACAVLAKRPILVGWNVRGFDLPVLIARAMRHGVSASHLWHRQLQDRYRGDLCLDLQDHVSLLGAGRMARMDAFARLCGWPGKVGVDGSMVAELWASGERDKVRAYNLCDVVQEAAILLRLLYCQGEIIARAHDEAMTLLIAAVDSMPELEALRGGIQPRAMVGGAR